MISSKKKLSFVSRIYERDGCNCWYCGCKLLALEEIQKLPNGEVPPNYPTLDHVIPRLVGGGDSLDNLRAACPECNNAKGYELPYEQYADKSHKQLLGLLRTSFGKNVRLMAEIKALKNLNRQLLKEQKQGKK